MKFTDLFKGLRSDSRTDDSARETENNTTNEKYTRRFFGLSGRIEPIKILFSIAEDQFKQNKIPDEDWKDVKTNILSERIPMSDLSLVDINGTTYIESLNIFHRVADILNLKGDNGDDKMISFQVIESMNETFNEIGVIRFNESLTENKKRELYEEYIQSECTQGYFKYMANLLNANTFFIGDNVTAADVYFACVMGFVLDCCPHVLDTFSGLKKQVETINELDPVKKCLEIKSLSLSEDFQLI